MVKVHLYRNQRRFKALDGFFADQDKSEKPQ